MSRIRYLDIDELNDRLAELEDLRAVLSDAEENLNLAQAELVEARDNERTEEEIEGREREIETRESDVEKAKSDFGTAEELELKKLEDLKSEIGESRGKISEDGGPFVDERDFEDYAQELADELGLIDRNASWPLNCIDWAYAAKELLSDYISIEWDGNTYLYRS